MPSWDLFEQRPHQRERPRASSATGVAVEAASSFSAGRAGPTPPIRIDRFGLSGPGDQVLAHLGFTAENVADQARALLRKTEDQEENK